MEGPSVEEKDDQPQQKINIITQPIFLLALLIIVLNVFLFLWSMNRDSTSGEKSPVESSE